MLPPMRRHVRFEVDGGGGVRCHCLMVPRQPALFEFFAVSGLFWFGGLG